jgi:hypothetical protein
MPKESPLVKNGLITERNLQPKQRGKSMVLQASSFSQLVALFNHRHFSTWHIVINPYGVQRLQ